MRYQFSDFIFDAQKLVLFKHEDIVALKRNQAELLKFFLLNHDEIHSKDDILDAVWADKEVSEQVVFQTISQLRALFGKSAIQTFAKRGYKWQLAVSVNVDENTTKQALINPPQNKLNSYGLQVIVGVALLVLLSIVTLFIQREEALETTNDVKIHLTQLQTTTDENDANVLAIQSALNNLNVDSIVIQRDVLPEQLFLSPVYSAKKLQLNSGDWFFWWQSVPANTGGYLRYGLSNGDGYWQGYVYSDEVKKLPTKLAQKLVELSVLGVFSHDNKALIHHLLSRTETEIATKPDVLLRLAQYYMSKHQTDAALRYFEAISELGNSNKHRPFVAAALFYQGKIYKMLGQYQLAEQAFNQMDTMLNSSSLIALQFELLRGKAWLAYAQGKIDEMHKLLHQGVEWGKQQNQPIALFELYTLYSILSEKTGFDEQKYDYLTEAQSVFARYQLDQTNLALVYYHMALFAKGSEQAVPFLQQLLALPRTANNFWVIDQGFERLVRWHISNQQYEQANDLLMHSTQNTATSYLLGQLYQAQGNQVDAINAFEQAFDSARTNFDVNAGLKAAMSLYTLVAPQQRAKYLAYMQKHGETSWLVQNQLVMPVSKINCFDTLRNR